MQLVHDQNFSTKTLFPVVIVSDTISFLDNIGSLFRAGDAFGVSKIFFYDENPTFNYRKIHKTSRNTHKTVPHEIITDRKEIIRRLQAENYTIIALEITAVSQDIREIQLEKDQKIALIIGNEVHGIQQDFLEIAHQTVHIQMHGTNSSMNVVQAAAIALYEIINQIK